MMTNFNDKWDEIDKKILQILRQHGKISLAQIASELDLASSTVSGRINRLMEKGILLGYRPVIDPEKDIAGLEAVLMVKFSVDSDIKLALKELKKHDVMVEETYKVKGDWDYILKVISKSTAGLDRALAALQFEGAKISVSYVSQLVKEKAEEDTVEFPRVDISKKKLYLLSLSEITPERIDLQEIFNNLKENGITTVCIDALNPWGAYYPTNYSAMNPKCFNEDLFGEFARWAENYGMEIYVVLDARGMAAKISDEHPTWHQRYSNGNSVFSYTGRFVRGCYNTGWAEFIKDHLKEILSRYQTHGVVLLNPEYEKGSCYCDRCREKFRMARGISLPVAEDWKDPAWLKFLEWKVLCVCDFIKEVKEIVKSNSQSKSLLVVSDMALNEEWYKSGADLSMLLETADGVIYSGSPDARWAERIEDKLEYLERAQAISNQNAVIISISSSYVPWIYYPVSETEMMLSIGELLSGGQQAFSFDLGRIERPQKLIFPQNYKRLVLEQTEPYYKYCALVFSREDFKFSQQIGEKVSHFSSYKGLYRLMNNMNIPFDVISLEKLAENPELINNYRVIILPNIFNLSETSVKALENSPASVLGTYYTAMQLKSVTANLALSNLFGFVTTNRVEKLPFCYVAAKEKGFFATLDDSEVIPAEGDFIQIRPDNCRIRATIWEQETQWGGLQRTGEPAIVTHKNKDRLSMYFLYPIGNLYDSFPDLRIARMFKEAIEWLAGEDVPVSTDNNQQVKLRVRTDGNKVYVYIINDGYQSNRKPVYSFVKQVDVRFRIKLGEKALSARSLLSGKEIPFESSFSTFQGVLPELEIFDIIEIGF